MSHVTHMNKSCHTHEHVMSHIWMSHVTHMNESCHTYEWVMAHIWMSHVTHINESCRCILTSELRVIMFATLVIEFVRLTYEHVMAHIWMSHVAVFSRWSCWWICLRHLWLSSCAIHGTGLTLVLSAFHWCKKISVRGLIYMIIHMSVCIGVRARRVELVWCWSCVLSASRWCKMMSVRGRIHMCICTCVLEFVRDACNWFCFGAVGVCCCSVLQCVAVCLADLRWIQGGEDS